MLNIEKTAPYKKRKPARVRCSTGTVAGIIRSKVNYYVFQFQINMVNIQINTSLLRTLTF